MLFFSHSSAEHTIVETHSATGMNRTMWRFWLRAGAMGFAASAILCTAARADTTACTLSFAMRAYSKHFMQSSGRGTIVCDNGQKAEVSILGRGANLANGAGAFAGGEATFSAVLDISALLGSYTLPASATVGNARPLGVAGAMSNGQATIVFPRTGPAATMPATFGRIGIIPRSPMFR
jgi:hypothetical protein